MLNENDIKRFHDLKARHERLASQNPEHVDASWEHALRIRDQLGGNLAAQRYLLFHILAGSTVDDHENFEVMDPDGDLSIERFVEQEERRWA
jgi:hypothetical protein